MKKIFMSIMALSTIVGINERVIARGGGGFHGGGGARGGSFHGGGFHGGGMRTAGTSRIRSSGASRYREHRIGKGGQMHQKVMHHPVKHHQHGGQHYHHGHWNHWYPYNYGLYPWGLFLLTAPWWSSWNWTEYYAQYPNMQNEINDLQNQLNENMKEMRRKDRLLATLEDRLDEALGPDAQAGLKEKIKKLKHELTKQAEKTSELDAKLKKLVGKK